MFNILNFGFIILNGSAFVNPKFIGLDIIDISASVHTYVKPQFCNGEPGIKIDNSRITQYNNID
jgi:hypothetical protein